MPQLTPFPTPTPGPDGRILYTVQPDDTLWRVAAVSGLTVDELRSLNNLSADAIITPGQVLLLGIGGPAIFTPTPGPTVTPPSATPTATPETNTALLCILLFDDQNGDAIRQDGEAVIPGGKISILERSGALSLEAESGTQIEKDCNFNPYTGFDPALGFSSFLEMPPGDYNVSVGVPEGYHPTTLMNYALRLAPGDQTYLDFGAQKDDLGQPAAPSTPENSGGSSAWLGILGGGLLLAGIGLALFANRLGGQR
ncbi:MAG: hypothetical protein Fur0018_05510 [Anaerolineales bacterium]